MASTLHQSSTPSPYTNKYHHGCFSDLSALANGAFSPLWGVDDVKYGEDFVVPETCSDILLFPDNPHGAPAELPVLPDCSLYFSGGGLYGRQDFNTMTYQMNDETNVTIQGFTSACSPAAHHLTTNGDGWGIQGQKSHAAPAENIRVGKYSVEERKDRILRYLKKRNQRNFNKTIKYACRKTLADRRIRVRGRFAKNNEEVDDHLKHNNGIPTQGMIAPCSYYDYPNHDIQMIRQDRDEWLQEAIASLMYSMPYNIPQAQWQGGLAFQ